MGQLGFDIPLGFALAMDATVVSVVIGMVVPAGEMRRWVARPAATFGGFQAAMVAIGWALGAPLLSWLPETALRVIVLVVLVALGLKMIVEARRDDGHAPSLPGWKELVGLALATSIDALGAGVSLRLLGREDVGAAALTIGLVTAALCLTATLGGRILARVLGRSPLVVGGVTLIGLGVLAIVGG